MELKNTKTGENLLTALAGESIARNKYTYFAEAARLSGNDKIADAFEQMALNEMTHAKFWFEALYGKPKDAKDCLTQAAQGEYEEWHNMYPAFAQQAMEDGFPELALMFEKVSAIERTHENRFLILLAAMSKQAAASAAPKQKKLGYRCQFCGHVSPDRPDLCDVCNAIGSYELVEYYE